MIKCAFTMSYYLVVTSSIGVVKGIWVAGVSSHLPVQIFALVVLISDHVVHVLLIGDILYSHRSTIYNPYIE